MGEYEMKLNRKTIELLIKALIYYDGGEWWEASENEDIDIAMQELEAALLVTLEV